MKRIISTFGSRKIDIYIHGYYNIIIYALCTYNLYLEGKIVCGEEIIFPFNIYKMLMCARVSNLFLQSMNKVF